jgi:hypothetical protein
MKRTVLGPAISLLLLGPGCASTVRLSPVVPNLQSGPIPVETKVDVPEKTATYEKVVRFTSFSPAPFPSQTFSFATVKVGEAVSQYAEAYLGRVFPRGDDVTIRVDLLTYAVAGLEATTRLRFTVTSGPRVLLQRDYSGIGTSNWGTALVGRKTSAVRQTSEESLRSCFEQFIADAQREYPGWRREGAATMRPWFAASS